MIIIDDMFNIASQNYKVIDSNSQRIIIISNCSDKLISYACDATINKTNSFKIHYKNVNMNFMCSKYNSDRSGNNTLIFKSVSNFY